MVFILSILADFDNILCNKQGNRERAQKEINNVGFLFGVPLVFLQVRLSMLHEKEK